MNVHPDLGRSSVLDTVVRQAGFRTQTDEHFLLVTTCWWPAMAQFAQMLVRAGCRVSALCPYGHPVQAVEGVNIYRQRAYWPEARLSEVVRATRPSMIVPADDRAVAYLHRIHKTGTARERALIERSVGAPDRYDVVLSRVKLLALAQQLEIAVPSSTAIKSTDAMIELLSARAGPWVIKVDGAWSGHGVRIVFNREQAFDAARSLRRQRIMPALKRLLVYRDPYWLAESIRRQRPELSVQSYIKGLPATLAMFCADGKVLAATMADVVANLGETGPSVIIRLVDRPEMLAAAHKLAGGLALTGFYGLDFMIEENTNRAFLIEMNPRLTPLVNVQVGKAGDLVAAAVRAVSGRRLPPSDGGAWDMVAHFPLPSDFNRDDPRLSDCFYNQPKDSPALVAEVLQQSWPDRRLLARIVVALRKRRLLD